MKKIICDGNEASARASYMFTELAGIYPITPSSPMPKLIDKWSSSGKKNILGSVPEVIEMQSEAGAIGLCHGSLNAGVLTSTYTASQGLLLMIPNMYKIAGEMWPFVMNVAARSLSTHALSIFGDHQDIYSTRSTGFCMLSSSSVQDAYYLGLVSHLSTLEASLPFMHFFDGFRTSHEINKIDVFDEDEVKPLVPFEFIDKFRKRALNNDEPVTRGTNQNPDIYFQMMESRNSYYDRVADIVSRNMKKINKLAHTDYKPFNYYGNSEASKVIVAMGSVCETIKEFLDSNSDYGLVEVHLYRPFSKGKLLDVLPNSVKRVAVLDRTKESGSIGEPLYLDVKEALSDKDILIVGGRYGLSSKDTTPGMIKAIYDMLDDPICNFTIGIDDDVTNLSIPYESVNLNSSREILVYGYGSDGMVSASKSIINILGMNNYVQGYFEYDSKKSGGVTKSHLRFSDSLIKSSYLVYSPELIVISKDSYLGVFDPTSNIKDGGVILINSSKNDDDILKDLKPFKKNLNDKKVKLYIIDANKLAGEYDLGRKISMIMAKAILLLMDIDDNGYLEKFINDKFGVKSKRVALNNINSLRNVKKYLRFCELDDEYSNMDFSYNTIYEAIIKRRGNDLKVSDFKGVEDGTFKYTKPEFRDLSDSVPIWKRENCIECSQCSLVCPHGVIRPYILNAEEYEKAPSYVKNICKEATGMKGFYYVIGISSRNCTGCGVCVNTCPGLRGEKALALSNLKDTDQRVFDYLDMNISEKNINKNTIKGSQNRKPKFAFHGACAGCGETPYVKLLTQLTDNLVIANATGCSSIYGGELPNLPYRVPWASSLFEDNAEFGFGILKGFESRKNKVREYMEKNRDELFDKWLSNPNDYDTTKYVYDNIDFEKHSELSNIKDDIIAKNVWCVGGDGWAYDIGFGGIDHVLSSNSNINILVLNTESYSNTGGQMSKATPEGAVAEFASNGKKTLKKDLARIAMSYPNVYVASISLGANMMQAIKAINEANSHNGPSIIIAYCPCIAHGIKGGMSSSINMEKLATSCGYYPIFRYDGKFNLDSPNVNFDLYEEFLECQTRYSMLKSVNEKRANECLELNKKAAMERFEFYKSMCDQ